MNTARGEVVQKIQGNERKLILDMAAIAELEGKLGIGLPGIAYRLSSSDHRISDLSAILQVSLAAAGTKMSRDDVSAMVLADLPGSITAAANVIAALFRSARGESEAAPKGE